MQLCVTLHPNQQCRTDRGNLDVILLPFYSIFATPVHTNTHFFLRVCFQNILAKAYDIQVSNDGEHYSAPATMVVYNSKCANCSVDDQGDAHCVGKVYKFFIL